ncbi:unnamed protein product [Diabrotica balteata]|uniref:DUF7869 domain-containing protein n=1 Tax=Diabrotica balteata TaxID=107213 RepID=A0A9P0DSK1_DIABA|nr:unnamed protein product [Diabrotica balteata]
MEDTTEMQLNAAAVVSDVPKDIPSSSSSWLINEIKQPPLELNSSTSTIHQDEEDPYEYSESSFVPSINSSTDNDFEITNEGEDENEKEVMVADYKSKGKKRLRNESTWQRNERKKKRMAGQQYKSSKTKKTIKERKVREPCRNCRLKCNENILGPQRAQIHRQFWNHETTIDQKRQFLCSCLEKMYIKRKRERTGARAGKRHCNWKYFFTVEGKRFQVCKFNLSFAVPSKDTCDKCDEFLINLRQSNSEAERETLQVQYNAHLLEADKRYKLKQIDKEMSINNPGQKVLMIDLQKCLACPKLTNSQSFYSLKLWCFNYTIYDSTEKQANCLMWDESIAGRGGNEMASCLVQYIHSLPQSTTSVVIWTDNCPSQNRNIQMIMCYFYPLSRYPHIKEITHKFLLRGHTHMEVDSIHSVIEREAKKCPNFQIITPWDWLQLARISGKNKDFKVYEMITSNFKDFNKLYNSCDSPFQNNKKTENNEKFLISQAVCMQFGQENPGIVYFKTDFDLEFQSVDFTRRVGRRNHQSLEDSLVTLRDT